MARVTLSRLAESDLKAIARYTRQRWGERQAAKYVSALRNTLREIEDGRIRTVRLQVGSLLLERVLYGRHYIYMQRSQSQILVSRVLHGAMDVHLQVLPKMPRDME